MFKVVDYLLQAQANRIMKTAALCPLDSRGSGNALFSLWFLVTALAKLVHGKLAGVHVNMAERMSLYRKSAVVMTCRTLGIPVVVCLLAAQFLHFYRQLPNPLQGLKRLVFSLPDACLVLGEKAQRFIRDEWQLPTDLVQVIINGVPEPTQLRRLPGQDPVQRVLFFGDLSDRKGTSDLLQALAQPGFDDRRLEVMLVGGGDVAGYQARALQLGIDAFVRFSGWADQAQVSQLMAQADVLVLPSYDEGLPLVILEAMVNGVAVVCTPVGEIPAVLSHGVNACFIQLGDTPGITAGLQRFLNDSAFREMLELNGRKLNEEKISLSRFAASLTPMHQRYFAAAAQPYTATVSPKRDDQ